MCERGLQCLDTLMIILLIWAGLDLPKNWENYSDKCEVPIAQWIISSIITIFVTRSYQLIAYAFAYQETKENL